MAVQIGDQIGTYRLVRWLGGGTFADVYLGEHLRKQTQAAIKVLKERLAHDNIKDFLNEARTIRLRHPHIIEILDFGLHDDHPYLVMPYLPTGSLRSHLPKDAPLPLPTAVSYIKQVAEALQYAHDEDVMHRDIKPENMLLAPDGSVMLSDFGISLMATQYIHQQAAIGTPPYMAPEQFKGEPHRASDQYALAVVAYEWLAGARPFKGKTYLELGYQHVHEPPPPLRSHVPELPPEVEAVVLRALAKDPVARFPSVLEFAQALEHATRPQKTEAQWYEEGRTHWYAKRYAEALACFEQALRLDSKHAVVWLGKGNALCDLKRPEEALAAFEQALRLDPKFASAWYNKGRALHDLKRYEEALAAYEQALMLDPTFAIAWNSKGAALHDLQRYEDALAACEQALKLDPNNALAWYNKGNALGNLQRYEEALAACEQALLLDPKDADAWTMKGIALGSLKRYEEALAACEQTLKLDPNDALAWYSKALTLERLGRAAEAKAAREKARELGYSG